MYMKTLGKNAGFVGSECADRNGNIGNSTEKLARKLLPGGCSKHVPE